MEIKDLVTYLMTNTSCYAEVDDQSEECILVDGFLYLDEILKLAELIKTLPKPT